MAWEKTKLTDINSANKILGPDVDYQHVFGASINHFLKPYSTNINSSGYPKFEPSLFSSTGVVGTGNRVFAGADSSGLNPIGYNVLGEGIIYGNNRASYSEITIDPNSARSYGLKSPSVVVGWGYDNFGYPVPNFARTWNVSGIFSPVNVIPSGKFLGSGGIPVSHGTEVPYSLFRAGPLDLRWNNELKRWSSPQSVYSAVITKVYLSGVAVSGRASGFSSDITYDAEIYDGFANKISVTGVVHVGPRPYNNAFKVFSLASGEFALMVHTPFNGRPSYGLYLVEPPVTVDCDTNTDPEIQPLLGGNNFLTYSKLLAEPLDKSYGGTGLEDHPPSSIMIGELSGSGNLAQYILSAGTGINIRFTSGNMFIEFSSGVLFTEGGVNNTITELQGLTTPLSIAQGGTGASGKIFVDLYSNQLVGGYKTFTSGIRLPSGHYLAPSLSFSNQTQTGLSLNPNRNGLLISASGNRILNLELNNSICYTDFIIKDVIPPPDAGTNPIYAPLIVEQYAVNPFTNAIQIWRGGGSNLAKINYLGFLETPSLVATGLSPLLAASGNVSLLNLTQSNPVFIGNAISYRNPSGNILFSVNNSGNAMQLGGSGNATIILSSSGNRTIEMASGYHGSVDVAKVGGGTRTLHFMHGLFVGFTDS
jgi:hypothetical protein